MIVFYLIVMIVTKINGKISFKTPDDEMNYEIQLKKMVRNIVTLQYLRFDLHVIGLQKEND